MESLSSGMGILFQAGSGFAMVLITLLSLGILAIAASYLIAAVVVMEGFARVAGRPSSLWLSGALTAMVGAGVIAQLSSPELSSLSAGFWWPYWLRALPWSVGGVVLCMLGLRAMFGWLGSQRVGLFGLGVAALGVSLLAGGSGMFELPAVALGAIAASSLILWLRRFRSEESTPSQLGPRLVGFAVLLAIGVVLTFAPEPTRSLAWDIGLWLLAVEGVVLLAGLLPLAAGGLMDLRGSVEWFVARRYLLAKRRQVFISVVTAICVVGIAAGVWLILVVLSVMNGFDETWREEILGNRAHFVVRYIEGSSPYDTDLLEKIQAVPGVVAASPFIDTEAMVRGRGSEIEAVRLRGIDPRLIQGVTKLEERMLSGSLFDLLRASEEEAPGSTPPPGILIGHQLASALAAEVGDRILLISPFGGAPTPFGPAPRLQQFRLQGVFRSGFQQYDEVFAYTTIPAVQDFRRAANLIDGFDVVTTDHYRSQPVGEAVASALGSAFEVRDWKEYFPAFFQALKTERIMMFLLLSMVMVVAAFVIVATLIMMIMEKSRDIAMLKAMGAEDQMVERVFALEGTMIGLFGTGLGVLASLAMIQRLGWIQDQIEFWTGVDALPASVYQFSSLPSRIDPIQFAIVIAIALALSLGATLLPSRQGSRVDPAEGLRHE